MMLKLSDTKLTAGCPGTELFLVGLSGATHLLYEEPL